MRQLTLSARLRTVLMPRVPITAQEKHVTDQSGPGDSGRPSPGTRVGVNGGIGIGGGRDVNVGNHNNLVSGHHNQTASGTRSRVVGGDDRSTNIETTTTIQNFRKDHPTAYAALVAVAVLGSLGGAVAGGAHVLRSAGGGGSGINTAVVSESGAQGAQNTAAQIRAAEKAGDASAWCTMVAPGDGGCQGRIGGAFRSRSGANRAQVDQVAIGQASLKGTDAQVPLSWKGKEQGTLPLVWSGGRWQMGGGGAVLVEYAGGVFLSLVDSQSNQLKLGGIPIQ
jgi:hypothetical protein